MEEWTCGRMLLAPRPFVYTSIRPYVRGSTMEQQHDHIDTQTHDDLQDCIEECLNCHAVCTLTLQHCIASGGELTDVHLIGILLDCAEMAQTSANFMLRGSPYHVVTCGACAEL